MEVLLTLLRYPAFGLQLCPRLSPLENSVVLLCVHVQWLLFQHLRACGHRNIACLHLIWKYKTVAFTWKRYPLNGCRRGSRGGSGHHHDNVLSSSCRSRRRHGTVLRLLRGLLLIGGGICRGGRRRSCRLLRRRTLVNGGPAGQLDDLALTQRPGWSGLAHYGGGAAVCGCHLQNSTNPT